MVIGFYGRTRRMLLMKRDLKHFSIEHASALFVGATLILSSCIIVVNDDDDSVPQPTPTPIYCPDTCPVVNPQTVVNRTLVIEAIDFNGDYIAVTNTSNFSQNLDGWWVGRWPDFTALPFGYFVDPGVTVVIFLVDPGVDDATHIHLNDPTLDLGPIDEFALYNSANFQLFSSFEAYAAWGDVGTTAAEPYAVDAQLWRSGDFIPICTGHGGLVAIGNTTSAQGYQAVPASCF